MTSRRGVEIVRSSRRTKTVQAVMEAGVIRVHVPASMTEREVDRYVADLVPRLRRRYHSSHIDLTRRTDELSQRFGLPRPSSVEWSEVQRRRWGSCTVDTGDIRVSARLAEFPPWVLDYVLVHELAHLLVADHSPEFQELVDRYPRAERARGYLIAKADAPANPGEDSSGEGWAGDVDTFPGGG